jgi:hypothetical protein
MLDNELTFPVRVILKYATGCREGRPATFRLGGG